MKSSMRLLGLYMIAIGSTTGAPLKEGEFTRVINDVKILPVESSPVPARTGDRITGRTAVSTGAQSRAELRFSDNTLTRLGANSVFRMDQSSRTVEVDKGVILLQVPKQMGGAKVRTAAVTAAVTGTTLMLEFTPDGFVKIIVIEGEVDVSLNERRNQFRTLVAGDMWLSRADDKKALPMPVQVDLERLKKTSKLLSDKEFPPLGNQKQMEGAQKDQANKKENGELVNTSFVIEGRGRNVTLFDADREHLTFDTEPRRALVVAEPPPEESGEFFPDEPSEPASNKPVTIPGTTVFGNQSSIDSSNAYNSVAGGFTELPGTVYSPGVDGPFGNYMYDVPETFPGLDELLAENESWFVLKGEEFNISGNPSVGSASGLRNLIMGATGDINFTAIPTIEAPGVTPGSWWALDNRLTDLVFTSLTGPVNFDGFSLTGDDHDVSFFADGPTSDVNIGGTAPSLISLPTGNFEAVAGRDVNVSGATVEAKNIKMSSGGAIRVQSGQLAAPDSISLQAKKGVKISNSSELRRLSQLDNPQLLIEAGSGSAEIVSGSSVDVDVVNVTSRQCDVRIMDSTISARQIKARVYDSGGTLLLSNAILGRGTNASELIRLYGEGSKGVRFVGDTTLRGNVVQIAGSQVSIDPGSRVRLSNPAGTTVFADAHHYNNWTNGNFTRMDNTDAVPVHSQSFGSRPGY